MSVKWYMIFQIWSATDKIFCHFGPFFALFPLNNPKNQNFEKLKKNPGDIIILNKCTKNHDHMLHCPLDMAHNRCDYFSFWAIFCPFTPDSPKNKNFKKMRKNLEISLFYITVQKIMIRWCTVPEIWWETDLIISHFGLLFALLLP